jgi:1-acyl-sn-glycerol-3-phosphate acyltransferase
VFFEVVLLMESAGVAISFVLWALEVGHFNGKRFIRRNFALQHWWSTTLSRSAIWLFQLDMDVEKPFIPTEKPILLFIRHASVFDTFVPGLFIASQHNMRLRYVLKKELLWDPCLDVVGHRIPNVFIDRQALGGATQSKAIARLASDLGSGEGVVIYPEGTRYTPEKQRRMLDRARKAGPAKREQAERFQSVLPPRLGGPRALLEKVPEADAVFCAHSGLESAVTLGHLLSGKLVGARIRLRFWTVPATSRPTDPSALTEWFRDEWKRVDEIVTAWERDT